MAQARVTEYFGSRKRNKCQPSKRRRIEISATDDDISVQKQQANQNVLHENIDPEQSCTEVAGKAVSVSTTSGAQNKSKTSFIKQVRTRKPRTAKKQVSECQSKITDAFQVSDSTSPTLPTSSSFSFQAKTTLIFPTRQEKETKSDFAEESTSVWDEHDGPGTTPQKCISYGDSETVPSRRQVKLKRGKSSEPAVTPNAEKSLVISTKNSRSARKCLTLPPGESSETQPKDLQSRSLCLDQIFAELDIPFSVKAVSPLNITPENVSSSVTKGPDVPTSPRVKSAMMKCKQLGKPSHSENTSSKHTEKLTSEDIKTKLAKCGKLEELKAHLTQMNKSMKELKKPVPKLKKFTKIDIEIEQTAPSVPSPSKSIAVKSESKAPAYERFHSLATPAPPTLAVPYKYKLLAEMFRGMDTAVSMLQNRSETCTFSKIKTAVQTLTKRNFEERNVGQIKTVYPTAYEFRQEKVPCFGDKINKYQLTMEANLETENENKQVTKDGKPSFSAASLLQRRNTFHTGLIRIVKKHHKEFLSKLDRPLNIPNDKITRWHPKFPLDEVPDVEPSPLPEPPFVKKYQSAKDVLDHTRGKTLPRVEQALENVASKNSSKPEIKKEPEQNAPKRDKVQAVKGIPLSLLEKIRAKEAKKLESALTRNPAEDRKTAMMSRLPDMIRVIRACFVMEKKPCIPVETMVQKLADNSRSILSFSTVEEHINLLLELAPEWLTSVQIKRGKYLKIDKNIDIQALSSKISNQVKARK